MLMLFAPCLNSISISKYFNAIYPLPLIVLHLFIEPLSQPGSQKVQVELSHKTR